MKTRTGYETPLSGHDMQNGDYVELTNQWAKVVISVEIDGSARIFKVTGDVVRLSTDGHHEFRHNELAFPSARDAWNCAKFSLSVYAKGRMA